MKFWAIFHGKGGVNGYSLHQCSWLVPSSSKEYIIRLRDTGKGKVLKISDQFPQPIVKRREYLIGCLFRQLEKGHKVKLIADRLYVNDILYMDEKTTWLQQ